MKRERERREIEAGLVEEVEAWLRGDSSRREALRWALKLGALGALPASMISSSVAWAAAELADPSTPLGQAQAAAQKASTEGPTDGSAYRAVQAAKAHKGITINMTYEAGLQAL